MDTIKNNYRDPEKFWDRIRKMKGNNITKNDHLAFNKIKLIQNTDKEKEHREIWQSVFEISEEENQNYN